MGIFYLRSVQQENLLQQENRAIGPTKICALPLFLGSVCFSYYRQSTRMLEKASLLPEVIPEPINNLC